METFATIITLILIPMLIVVVCYDYIVREHVKQEHEKTNPQRKSRTEGV